DIGDLLSYDTIIIALLTCAFAKRFGVTTFQGPI
ncbi:unnamed protein product, partial [marine sediment metagenome]